MYLLAIKFKPLNWSKHDSQTKHAQDVIYTIFLYFLLLGNESTRNTSK